MCSPCAVNFVQAADAPARCFLPRKSTWSHDDRLVTTEDVRTLQIAKSQNWLPFQGAVQKVLEGDYLAAEAGSSDRVSQLRRL